MGMGEICFFVGDHDILSDHAKSEAILSRERPRQRCPRIAWRSASHANDFSSPIAANSGGVLEARLMSLSYLSSFLTSDSRGDEETCWRLRRSGHLSFDNGSYGP
jgi:hypothetical protein